MNRTASAPLRIDFCGGSLDIQPIPTEMGPVSIISAAINRRVEGSLFSGGGGTVLSYHMPLNVPTSSGLGSSGVMNSVWLALVTSNSDPHWIASRVYRLEQATDVVGGVQDQYTACYGGINEIVMNGERVWIRPILQREDPRVKELEDRLVLVDSGIMRPPSTMNEQFIDRYRKGELYDELLELNCLSHDMCDAMCKGALDVVPPMLDKEWSLRKQLMPCNSEEIDLLIKDIKGIVPCGCKVLGQGGGGVILMMTAAEINPTYIPDAIADINTIPNVRTISFGFDFEGLIIREEM
jgi:D-glycero-alpha-D-manno-heptose-7-phosphate kinase